MKKHIKKKKHQSLKPFDVGAYELHNNGLYKHKVIPNKKKQESLKRKKVDIREYQPFLLSCCCCLISF
ncbi:MAG: hypothetical protein IKW39_00010 [Alphaproteobacteria bacterium]|nr:hypothetical protein [Alphaproteobacteria bacterium]